jgi:hypothetical protein
MHYVQYQVSLSFDIVDFCIKLSDPHGVEGGHGHGRDRDADGDETFWLTWC